MWSPWVVRIETCVKSHVGILCRFSFHTDAGGPAAEFLSGDDVNFFPIPPPAPAASNKSPIGEDPVAAALFRKR